MVVANTEKMMYATETSMLSGKGASITYYCNILLSLTGIFGNLVAVVVLGRNKNIRKSLSSTLLIGQSVVDGLSSILVFLLTFIGDLTNDTGWAGLWGQLVCYFWISDFWVYALMVVSSFNLVALTLERALCVSAPVLHREYVTRRTVRYMVAMAWVLGVGSEVAFLVPTTGLRDGHCVDWDIFPSAANRRLYGVAIFFQEYGVHIIVIAVSYVVILVSLAKREAARGVSDSDQQRRQKRGLLRTVVVVVMVYVLLTTPRALIYLLFNFGISLSVQGWLYRTAILMNLANSCINPLIYTFHLKDYQMELKKIMKLILKRSARVRDLTSSVTDANSTTLTDIE